MFSCPKCVQNREVGLYCKILTFGFVDLFYSDSFRGQDLALPQPFCSVDGTLPSTCIDIDITKVKQAFFQKT